MDKRTEKRKTGDLGENLAAIWLEKRGFRILARNYLLKYGELDIVAEKDKVIHFVEVKSVKRFIGQKASDDEYEAEENVHPWKLKRLYTTISIFLENNKLDERDWQLDIIVAELDDERNEGRVRILEDVG
ncbi:MAG: YraN family protein [Candidatus Vogelbacteria bacterium]|nr:YraN family protein [Candidatus Vogelbacteria bacterium]